MSSVISSNSTKSNVKSSVKTQPNRQGRGQTLGGYYRKLAERMTPKPISRGTRGR